MNKTILITGSTDGIGKLATLQLAQAGHRVLLHGRNRQKLETTIQEIKEAINHNGIHGFVADLTNSNEVDKLANEVMVAAPKLDVLINNAGVFHSSKQQTKEGLDIRFMVNHIAPYLLTKKLVPALKKVDSARILNLSSAAQSPVSLNALMGKETLSVQEAYAQSKLALTMWSLALAKQQSAISVVAVNPGSLLNTKMVQEAYGQHWSPADKGAKILYDLAVGPQYKGVTGKYFDNDLGAFGKAHQDAYDKTKIDQLLSTTESALANLMG